MKELSIEEKARRYDELKVKAQELEEDGCFDKLTLFVLFPELEESEDEKIRKGLIAIITDFESLYLQENYALSKEDALAWLEKQGDKDKFIEKELGCIKGYRENAIKRLEELEKQDEQKPYSSETMNEKRDFDNGFTRMMEKEQKSTDKVEPKFKSGDWVVNKFGNIKHIVRIENDCYYAEDIGGVEWYGTVEYGNTHFYLWTIKDAKDGDVLYLLHEGKEHIIIYKGVIKERFKSFVSAYCAYNGIVDAFCFADVSRYIDITYGGIMPATKEQRDLLFQKMKEAGYEWDVEKKELKKIEQKTVQETEPFEAEHGKYYYCIKDYFCGGKKQASKGDVVQALRGLPIMGLKDASEYFLPVNLIKCNPAWSEEDKRIIDNLISQLGNLYARKLIKEETKDKYVNWLKSLRPQKRWEPTEEQMKALYEETQKSNRIKDDRIVSLYNDLKKLREE